MITWHEIAKEGYSKEDGRYLVCGPHKDDKHCYFDMNDVLPADFYSELPSTEDERFGVELCSWDEKETGKPAFVDYYINYENGLTEIYPLRNITHWSEITVPTYI